MSEFDDLPTIETGLYRHYKGNEYNVLGVGCHTEAHEYFVVYAPAKPKPGAMRPGPRPAVPVSAPVVGTAPTSDPHRFGRVDPDGTVWLISSAGERTPRGTFRDGSLMRTQIVTGG